MNRVDYLSHERENMKIAAIDIGSNSLHMVIAEADRSGSFRVLDGEKEMVRLGARTLSSGRLPAAATRNALEVLTDYKRLAESHGVDTIVAVATSAIREARNGEDLIDRIGREVGIYARPISGEEEAGFVYLAAQHSIHVDGKRALVIDIGGGSVEIAVGSGAQVEYAASEKIGVLRMAERFVESDPLLPRERKRVVGHVTRMLTPHLERLRELGFDTAVGTSGTILALGALAHERLAGKRADLLHHLSVPVCGIREVGRELVDLPLSRRLRVRGLAPERADIIAVGAVILETILDLLDVEEIILSEWALREGVLLHYIHQHPRKLERAEDYPDVRRRSVIELAERCQYDEKHARHVADLSSQLFDQTRTAHGLGRRERELMEHAAILHDIGHHISHPRHHRHSHYLIRNGGLRGFEPLEVEVMAGIARYHRRGIPKKRQPDYGSLPQKARRTIRILAGILRVADALDRGHGQKVRRITARRRSGVTTLRCTARGEIELELWGARRRVDLLERALGSEIRLSPVGAGRAPRIDEGSLGPVP